MACNTCNTKFNFFHKEMGCANCGMSFCNKCLKQKCKIPSKGLSELNVCRICFNKLMTVNENVKPSFIPPDTFLKRLENLENPSAPPITVYKQNPKFQKLRTGLTPVDQRLVDRLEKLKENNSKPEPPSETELRERLAHLKGENVIESSERSLLPPVDNRTSQEKVDDLLKQFKEERDIELYHNPQEEMKSRLATLKEQGVRPDESVSFSNLDSDDSDEEIRKITKKMMDEVALEDTTTRLQKMDAFNTEKEEETLNNPSAEEVLPWCVLCNNDAQFRCLECGGDLYCAKCNKEIHKEWDRDHQVVPFKQK